MTQLQFLGGAGTVTGSKAFIESGEKKILVDCGLFQGLKVLRLRNREPLPFAADKLDAVLLTHAHLDHTGALPLLIKAGFRGPIFATPATMALLKILLPDAGYLQEEEARFANKHGFSKHNPALPLFTKEDAERVLGFLKPIDWHTEKNIGSLNFSYSRAGHILGSGLLKIKTPNETLLFSGDLGRLHSNLMQAPEACPSADTIVVESTYGNRKHPDENPNAILRDVIKTTAARGGIVLIPAFAVGRSQQILQILDQIKQAGELPDIPIFLNSPMAIEATKIYSNFTDEQNLDDATRLRLANLATCVVTSEESKRLAARTEPAVIISASGMATGGRVLHHLKALLPDPKNTVVLAGYQAAGTRGEALEHGVEQIKIHGEQIPARAQIQKIETLSAHADSDEILFWLKSAKQKPKQIFINHGEPQASEALRVRIQNELGWRCTVADHGVKYNL